MEMNIPRASIHVGADKKSFSAQMGHEAERRGWDEKRYQSKNAETEKNNHYNFSRKHLNFEITKGCEVMPLAPILFHFINASNSATMNLASNLTWMQNIPIKLLKTVRTDW